MAHPLRYMPHLDGLRGAMMLVVMAVHYKVLRLVDLEALGVLCLQCFFVLSGFLITRILWQSRERMVAQTLSGSEALKRFYARRFLRVFPLYYLAVFVAAAVGIPGVRDHFVWHVAYLTNWRLMFHGMYPVAHFWSLSVEEQFYLLWPLFVLFLPANRVRPFLYGCWALAVLARLGLFFGGAPKAWIYVPTPVNLDFLALGALVGIAWEEADDAWISLLQRLALLAVVPWALLFAMTAPYYTRFYLAFGSIFSGPMLAYVVHHLARGEGGGIGWLTTRPLVDIGKVSYGIYILHRFAQYATEKGLRGEVPYWGLLLVATALTFALATASWHLYEKPALSFKRWFRYAG